MHRGCVACKLCKCGRQQPKAWLEKYNGGVSAGVINTAKVMKNVSYPKAGCDGFDLESVA